MNSSSTRRAARRSFRSQAIASCAAYFENSHSSLSARKRRRTTPSMLAGSAMLFPLRCRKSGTDHAFVAVLVVLGQVIPLWVGNEADMVLCVHRSCHPLHGGFVVCWCRRSGTVESLAELPSRLGM